MPSIYLAGKISTNDWRQQVVNGLEDDWFLISSGVWPGEWPVTRQTVLGTFDYAGPYFAEQCNHSDRGCSLHEHAQGSICEGYSATRNQTFSRCLNAISRSDIVFAWLDDDLTAYGTLVELGYARALGKRIVIASPWSPSECTAGGHCSPGGCPGEGEYPHPDNPADELWFAFESATQTITTHSPREALLKLIDTEPSTEPQLDSPIEKKFWQACAAMRPRELHGMKSQHPVLGGRYRVDFALPAARVAIELDGYAYHSDRASFTKDRQRQRDLEAAGWRVIRFSGAEINKDARECVRQAARLTAGFTGTT